MKVLVMLQFMLFCCSHIFVLVDDVASPPFELNFKVQIQKKQVFSVRTSKLRVAVPPVPAPVSTRT